jgi:hypothetical protein
MTGSEPCYLQPFRGYGERPGLGEKSPRLPYLERRVCQFGRVFLNVEARFFI